jgi:hypothetical protein
MAPMPEEAPVTRALPLVDVDMIELLLLLAAAARPLPNN